MKKRYWYLLALLLCIISFYSGQAEAEVLDQGECGDHLTWTIDDENVLVISGEGPMTDYHGDVPWARYIERGLLDFIVIEEGVTSIGDYAFFDCYSLEQVTIPDTVTSIGDFAFDGCTSMLTIDLPSGISKVGDSAFARCIKLKGIELPEKIKTVPDSLFEMCYGLEDVRLPDGLESIGDGAFYECDELKTIRIPDSVTEIRGAAFMFCIELKKINIPDGVQQISNLTFSGCKSLLEISLPDSVTIIEDRAFQDCPLLDIAGLPDQLLELGAWSFSGCRSLSHISISNTVTEIGGGAFSGCTGLTGFDVAGENDTYCSVDGIIFNKERDRVIAYPAGKTQTEYVIPSKVKVIGEGAFSECTKLEEIKMPDGLEEIGEEAFSGCSSLKQLAIPEGIETLTCCRDCSSLKKIDLPSSLTSIGARCFSGCKSLQEILLPDNLAYIGMDSFSGCSSLQEIRIPDKVTDLSSGIFKECTGLLALVIPENVKVIEENAFLDCSSLQTIYYGGTQAKWEAVSGLSASGISKSVVIVFESDGSGEDLDQKKADSVIAKIMELDQYSSREEVASVRRAYESLSDHGKTLIPEEILANLLIYEKRYKDIDDQREAEFLEEIIGELDMFVEGSYIDYIDQFNYVWSVYTKLTEDQKQWVKKESLQELLRHKKAVKDLEDQIAAWSVESDLDCLDDNSEKEWIVEARKKYDALTEDQKKWVSREALDKLIKQEKRIAREEAETSQSRTTKKVKVKKIILSCISHQLAAGKKVAITARISPANASYKKLTWTSSNKKWATVTSGGKVTLKKNAGGKSVVITARAADGSRIKASWSIKIRKGAVKKITIRGKKSQKAGSSQRLKASVKASKGANTKLLWTSSNKRYATVTSKGIVRALRKGRGKTVTITAKATDGSNISKSIRIKIR